MPKNNGIFSKIVNRVDGLLNNKELNTDKLDKQYTLAVEREARRKRAKAIIKQEPSEDGITTKMKKVNKANLDLISKIPTQDLTRISKDIYSKNVLKEKILKALPDMELSAEISVSSTLSPMDISVPPSFSMVTEFSKLPTSVTNELDTVLYDDLTSYYKLDEKLYTITYDALITKGAYCEMLIAESSAVNSVREYFDSMVEDNDYDKLTVEGLITTLPTGNKPTTSLTEEVSKLNLTSESEKHIANSFSNKFDSLIHVVTDPKILLIKDELLSTQESERVSKENSMSAGKKAVLSNIFDILVDDNVEVTKRDKLTKLSDVDLINDNRPVVLKLPVESVIPLYLKNDPSDHLGYIVLTDETGSPVSYVDDSDVEMGIEKEEEEVDKRALMTEVLRTATINTSTDNKNVNYINNIENVASKLVATRIERLVLKDGIHSLVDEKSLDLIYKTVMQKIRANEQVNFLYVEKEKLNYMAFKFKPNGTGEAILDGVIDLASMRLTGSVAKHNAEIRNSIPNEHFEITLPEDDPDAPKTMKAVMSSIMDNNKFASPKGLLDIQDINKWVTNSGKTFNFNHPALPKITVDRSDRNTNIQVPDEETENRLRKQSIMKFGLTPEMVDNSYSSDFATTVVASHSLLGKRVLNRQGILEKLLNSYAYNAIMSDGRLYRKLIDIITGELPTIKKFIGSVGMTAISDKQITDEQLITYLLEEYAFVVGIRLPKPYGDDSGLAREFEKYQGYVDDYIEQFISSDMLPPELVGSVSDDVDAFQYAIKNSLLRDWCNSNGYMTELSNMFSVGSGDGDGFKLLEEYRINKDKLVDGLLAFMKDNKRKIKKDDKKYEKINADETPDDTPPDDNNPTDTPPDNGDNPDDTPPDDSSNPDDTPPDDNNGGDSNIDDMPTDDGMPEDAPIDEQSHLPNKSLVNDLSTYDLLSAHVKKNNSPSLEVTEESTTTIGEYIDNTDDVRKKEEFLNISKDYLANTEEVNMMVKQIVDVFDTSKKIHQLFMLDMKDIIATLMKHGIATKGFADVEAMNKMVKEYYGVDLPSIKNEIHHTMFNSKFETVDNMRHSLIVKEEDLLNHDYHAKFGLAKYDGFKLIRVKDVEDRFDSMDNDIKHSEIINLIHKGILSEWKAYEIKKYIAPIVGFEKSSDLDINDLIKSDNQQYSNLMAGISVPSETLNNDVQKFFSNIFDNIETNSYMSDDDSLLYSEALVRAFYSIDKRVFGAYPEHYFRFKDGKKVVIGKDALGNDIYLLASLRNVPIDKQTIIDKSTIDYGEYVWTSVDIANRKDIVKSISDGNTYKTRISFNTVEPLPEESYDDKVKEAQNKKVDPSLLLTVLEDRNSETSKYTKDRLKSLLLSPNEDVEDLNNIVADKLRVALNKQIGKKPRNIAIDAFNYMFEDWRGANELIKMNVNKSKFFRVRNADYVENHQNYRDEKFRGLFKPKEEFISYEDELKRIGKIADDNNIAKLLEVQVQKMLNSKPSDFDFTTYLKRLGKKHSDDYKEEDIKNYLELFKENLSKEEISQIRGTLATSVIGKLQDTRKEFFDKYYDYISDKQAYVDYLITETFGGTTEWDSKHSDSAIEEVNKIRNKALKVMNFENAITTMVDREIPMNNVGSELLSGNIIPAELSDMAKNMYMVTAKQIDGKYDNDVFTKYKGIQLLNNCNVELFNGEKYDKLKEDGCIGYMMSGEEYITITNGVIPDENNVIGKQYNLESYINAEDSIKTIIANSNKFDYDLLDTDADLGVLHVNDKIPVSKTYYERINDLKSSDKLSTTTSSTVPVEVVLNRITNYKKVVHINNELKLLDVKKNKVSGIGTISDVENNVPDFIYGNNEVLKDIRTIMEHAERYKGAFDKAPEYLSKTISELYNKYEDTTIDDYPDIDKPTINELLENTNSRVLDVVSVMRGIIRMSHTMKINDSDIDEMMLYLISNKYIVSDTITHDDALEIYNDLKDI